MFVFTVWITARNVRVIHILHTNLHAHNNDHKHNHQSRCICVPAAYVYIILCAAHLWVLEVTAQVVSKMVTFDPTVRISVADTLRLKLGDAACEWTLARR